MPTPAALRYAVPSAVRNTGEWIAGNPFTTVPPKASNSSDRPSALRPVVSKRLPSPLALPRGRLAHLSLVYTASERVRFRRWRSSPCGRSSPELRSSPSQRGLLSVVSKSHLSSGSCLIRQRYFRKPLPHLWGRGTPQLFGRTYLMQNPRNNSSDA